MSVGVIIVAAGQGRRMGASVPKPLLDLGGQSILRRSVSVFDSHPAVRALVVVLPERLVASGPSLVGDTARPCSFVAGGARRQDSVRQGFAALPAECPIVLVHDAARPFAGSQLIDRVIAAAGEAGAALPAVPARDTVKRVDRGTLLVRETIPRDEVWLAQTPQGFRRDVLAAAVALGGSDADATDEAMLVERAGYPVRVVDGDPANLKITSPEDLKAAEAMVATARPARTGRAGLGYDLHRLVEGRPLILGGVRIPFERGLAGHSDADAVCHAIIDAILGAAGAGNVGQWFPDTDPQWAGVSSLELLRRAAAIVRGRSLEIGNVDATVIAEHPRLAPFLAAMCANIARELDIDVDRVSVKGKTNEGVGELGRGEAIAVHAIALVRRAGR
jgi:2-C-methyl-D-erythritol 4-phosphate cytidylyltransferase/2-C-methyl-D-erythritol 2,4-cyclodiphosphate synthase